MKVYDCITYFDEDLLLDVRLNELNNYVEKFIIIESKYTHSGKIKKQNFDINNFYKFKKKIEYIYLENDTQNIQLINENDTEAQKNSKLILNGMARDFHQRNYIKNVLNNIKVNNEDYIIISDLDEIPNLNNFQFLENKSKIIIFKQKNFYYKFNLYIDNYTWFGSRACKFKDLDSPQLLRNIKAKNYSVWRFDTLFSNNKYQDVRLVENGGWHFSYLKTAEDIERKLLSYAHHREYDLNPLGKSKISYLIINKIPIYDLKTDMKKNKFSSSQKLSILKNNQLPNHIKKNINSYKEWLD